MCMVEHLEKNRHFQEMMNIVLQITLRSLTKECCPLSHPWPWNLESCKKSEALIVSVVKLRAEESPCVWTTNFSCASLNQMCACRWTEKMHSQSRPPFPRVVSISTEVEAKPHKGKLRVQHAPTPSLVISPTLHLSYLSGDRCRVSLLYTGEHQLLKNSG